MEAVVSSASSWSTESAASEALDKPRVSTVEAFVNLVKVIIGAGILVLPQLPQRSGFVLAALLLVISGLAVQESSIQLWKALMAANVNANDEKSAKVTTYEALAETALGLWGRIFTVAVVNIFLLGVCSAYAALIGMQLHKLTGIFDQRIWLLIASPIFVILALLPNLSVLSKFVPLGMLAACLMAAMVVWRALEDAGTWRSWDQDVHHLWPTSFAPLGSALATCVGAFTLIPMVPPIVRDMYKPESFSWALNAALLTCGILYLGVMLCGYYGYGSFISEDIVESMSRSPNSWEEAMSQPIADWTGVQRLWIRVFMSILILVNITLSMPLLAMAVFYSIESFDSNYVVPGSWSNWIMRTGIIAGIVAVAWAVPRFTVVFGFFSSLAAPCVSLILPLVIAGCVLGKAKCWRRTYHGVLVLIAVSSMFSGMYTSVMDVAKS